MSGLRTNSNNPTLKGGEILLNMSLDIGEMDIVGNQDPAFRKSRPSGSHALMMCTNTLQSALRKPIVMERPMGHQIGIPIEGPMGRPMGRRLHPLPVSNLSLSLSFFLCSFSFSFTLLFLFSSMPVLVTLSWVIRVRLAKRPGARC